jgi:hypothetical protein
MKLLVKNQKENEPKELVMPGKEEAKSSFMMKKHKKIWWAQRKDICDCEGTMHPGYEEQSGEPEGPRLDGRKWWCHLQDSRTSMSHWLNTAKTLHHVLMWESHWGTPAPTAAATNEMNEKTSKDNFITCVFLQEWIPKGMESWNYPKTVVESAVTMLSRYYMNSKGVHMIDEDIGQTDQKSFMQKHKKVTCYKCGKKGHFANKCPDGDNNDKASIRSSLSNRSNRSNNRVGWSG